MQGSEMRDRGGRIKRIAITDGLGEGGRDRDGDFGIFVLAAVAATSATYRCLGNDGARGRSRVNEQLKCSTHPTVPANQIYVYTRTRAVGPENA